MVLLVNAELNDARAAATLASFTLLAFISSIIELLSVDKYSLQLCRGLTSLVMQILLCLDTLDQFVSLCDRASFLKLLHLTLS